LKYKIRTMESYSCEKRDGYWGYGYWSRQRINT
jgi:hypothetical protein